jgi:uncharacterized protein YgfB (UPF0149 family)
MANSREDDVLWRCLEDDDEKENECVEESEEADDFVRVALILSFDNYILLEFHGLDTG